MDSLTPPRKKQRLSDQLSSSLVNSPEIQNHESKHENQHEIEIEKKEENEAEDEERVNEKENINNEYIETIKATSVSNTPTPLKSVNQSNNNTPNHSIITSNSSLSPIKSLKLTKSTDLTTDSDDLVNENNPESSFKQLENRFHSILSKNIVDEDQDNDNDDENNNNNDNNDDNDDVEKDESSSQLINFNNNLSNLKNHYQNEINSLQRINQEHLSTINHLNNQINDYKTKISNLHLTIEQSNLDLTSSSNENEVSRKEIEILKKSIAKLDNQLIIENSKKSKLLIKLNQLTELLETVFKSYKNLHEKNNILTKENSNLQEIILKNENKISSFDDTLKSELESLAQELYIQYAEKHETKISKLRTAYENKYAKKQLLFNERLKVLQEQQQTLQQELSHVKNRLQVETNEKHQLVKLWDEYVDLDKKDVDKMSDFVKRLK